MKTHVILSFCTVNGSKKVKTLKNVPKSLWFADSFSIKCGSLRVVDNNVREFDLFKDTNANFADLCDEDKMKNKSLLYIIDSFGYF